jgi:hypothetical protein
VLVTTHGTVRYGDHTLMHELHSEPDHPLEDYSVAGVEKAFNFYAPSSELNSLTFTEARKLLQNALVDLPAFREEMEQKDARLNALGLLDTQPFTVELDNEYSPAADELIGALTDVHLLVEEDEIASSIDLDLPEVNSPGYWERIDAQANIDDRLREVLKNSYAKEDLTQ